MHRKAVLSHRVFSVGACLFMTGAVLCASETRSEKAPSVGFATRHGKSARLSDYRPVGPIAPRPNREVPNRAMPRKGSGVSRPASDPVAQREFGLSQPEQLVQFEGGSDDDNAADSVRTQPGETIVISGDRKSTRLNSSHCTPSRMPSSA